MSLISRKFLPIVTLSLWSAGILLFSGIARAEVKLTSATIRALRNQVEFQPSGQRWRGASQGMVMQPLDALRTSVRSWAELRFNDRSLARIGERALFQFLPNTRSFNLQNGTVLLLIPPGQGRTQLQTPNAITGIRGSALFVRYNPATETTLVGALTNSEIEVSLNREGTQPVTLKAGQMAVLVQDKGLQIFNFDLKSFYETSEIVKDLDLSRQQGAPSSDEAIAAVQAETAEALQSQTPVTGSDVTVNPAWISLGSPPVDTSSNPLPTGIDVLRRETIGPPVDPNITDLVRTPTSTAQPTGKPASPVSVDPVVPPPDPGRGPEPPRPVPDSNTNVNPVRPTPSPAPIAPSPAPVASPQPPAAPPAPVGTQPTPPPPVTPQPPATPQPPVVPQPTPVDPVRPQPLPINPTPVVTPPPATTPVVTPAPVAVPPPAQVPVQITRPVPTPTPVTPTPVVNPPTTSPPVVTTPPTVTPTPVGATTPAIAPTTPSPATPVPPTVELTPPATSLTAPNLTPANVVSPAPAPAPAPVPVVTPTPTSGVSSPASQPPTTPL